MEPLTEIGRMHEVRGSIPCGHPVGQKIQDRPAYTATLGDLFARIGIFTLSAKCILEVSTVVTVLEC